MEMMEREERTKGARWVCGIASRSLCLFTLPKASFCESKCLEMHVWGTIRQWWQEINRMAVQDFSVMFDPTSEGGRGLIA